MEVEDLEFVFCNLPVPTYPLKNCMFYLDII